VVNDFDSRQWTEVFRPMEPDPRNLNLRFAGSGYSMNFQVPCRNIGEGKGKQRFEEYLEVFEFDEIREGDKGYALPTSLKRRILTKRLSNLISSLLKPLRCLLL